MQYIDKEIVPELKLIFPPSLKELGYVLQDAWGVNKVFIAQSLDLFFEFLKAKTANAWACDGEFLNSKDVRLVNLIDDALLLLLRPKNMKLSADMLNKWQPCAFLDVPFEMEQMNDVKQKLLISLHAKQENELFKSIKNNISKKDTKTVVLDMDRAFDKEINIIRNDMYYQQLSVPQMPSKKVRLDMFYKSMELLCGDSYSLRQVDGDRVFCFIIDAMAKGISAALTSTTSTSIMNYLIDEMIEKEKFDFNELLSKYIEFVKKELLDDEIVAAFFVLFDKNFSTMEYSAFGTPPFLLASKNKVEKVLSNNMPIFKDTKDFKIDIKSLKGKRKALMYSDGLCESELDDGRLYRSKLPQDFLDATNIVTFTNKMRERIGSGNDDIAFFYFDLVDIDRGIFKKQIIKSTRDDIDEALLQIPDFLEQFKVSPKVLAEVSLTLTELLMNALEHGSFGLGKFHKHTLIENNLFDDFIERLEATNSRDIPIEFSMRVYSKNERNIFEACIKDKGKGFDTTLLKNLVINTGNFNGRGFMIIKKLVDRFYFNEKGNEITVLKFLD